ncbi:MAG: hypothetical protein K1X71_09140 [Pirellulales bacterium]|nr:hypothetical protein [Pirellulales bacterium]
MPLTQTSKITLARLCAAVAILAVALVMTLGGLSILETERLRVHPSERSVADAIRRLGGAYRAVGKDDWHITSVWLENTRTTDHDLEAILQLNYVEFLDVANTKITDASLGAIFAHKSIRVLRVAGSDISREGLQAAWDKSGKRISLDD